MLEKGFVQIYTGEGKGKTTAAVGLAVRAAGRGHKVLFYQFLKPESNSGELHILKTFKKTISTEALDVKWDLFRSLKRPQDIISAKNTVKEALEKLIEIAAGRFYDVIILDEIVFCLNVKIAYLEQIQELIAKKHPKVELILTGRGAGEELIKLADLVTEMVNIKHPFEKGINARKGIEF